MSGEMSRDFSDAVFDGDLMAVQRMLQEGVANINERSRHGRTALLIALDGAEYSWHIAQWLLEYGGSSITEIEADG
jgi:ankyrin repeat protein